MSKFSELGKQLQNEARQQQTSSRIFDAALQFYENVLVERGDDPLVRFQAASAFLRAGEIREILGQQDYSGALIDRAVELLEGLNAGQGSIAQRRELVFALRLQATNARHNGEATKAEAAYRRCLDITEFLLRVDPHNVATVTHSGKVRISFAIMLKGEQRLDEVIEWHRESIDILRSAVARWPDEDACQIELANALNATGATLWYARRIPEAEPHYRESFDLSQKLFARLPNHLAVRSLYARSLLSMIRCDIAAEQLDTAAARFDEAARVMNELVTSYPDNIHYLSETLWLWQSRLEFEQRRHNTPLIDRAWRMELGFLGNLFRRLPPASRYDERFALSTSRYADWLWSQGRTAEARDHFVVALQVLKQVSDRLPDDAAAQQQLAWQHAVCPVVELRDIPVAESLATRATELSPDDHHAWQALGAAQFRAEKFPVAEASLCRGLMLSPNPESCAALHSFLAMTLHPQERDDEAISELALALASAPSEPLPQLVRLLEECRIAVKPVLP